MNTATMLHEARRQHEDLTGLRDGFRGYASNDRVWLHVGLVCLVFDLACLLVSAHASSAMSLLFWVPITTLQGLNVGWRWGGIHEMEWYAADCEQMRAEWAFQIAWVKALRGEP